MEESLSIDNILTGTELENLFIDNGQDTDSDVQDTDDSTQEEVDKKKNTTTEVNSDNLFEEPESVGSGETHGDGEDTDQSKGGTASPKFFSSIAKAFAEEGIFPDLDEDTISKVKSPEDFRDLIEALIKSELDERQRRIDEALNVGVLPDTIKYYENTLKFIDNITNEALTDESDRGENLRKTLIMQDFINRGYSKERAERAAEKSFKNGDDIEDAQEALKECRTFFKQQYNDITNKAKEEAEKETQLRKQQAAKLKESILTDKKFFGELEVDKATRQRIFDSIAKPVYKDPETGEVLTAIQKYEMENRVDFLKNLGLIFTLTDGFKTLDSLVKGKVKKEVKKGFRDLERTLNNTSRSSDGSLLFVSSVNEDPESFLNGWTLNV